VLIVSNALRRIGAQLRAEGFDEGVTFG